MSRRSDGNLSSPGLPAYIHAYTTSCMYIYVPQLQRMMHACINHSVIRVDIPAVKARQMQQEITTRFCRREDGPHLQRCRSRGVYVSYPTKVCSGIHTINQV
jgi:hypothetical protein